MAKLFRCLALGLLCWALPVFANGTSALKQIKTLSTTPTQLQLILSLDSSVAYKYFFLTNPLRLVIDLPHTLNRTAKDSFNFSQTLAEKLRLGSQPQQDLRLVFDLNQPASVLIAPIAAKGSAINLMINLQAKTNTANKLSSVPTRPTNLVSHPKPAQANQSLQPVLSLNNNLPPRQVVIVIDPGHGGKDPGASGPGGLHEKDIVLGISKALYVLLQQEPGVKVYMTRYGDYYLGLRQRLQVARNDKADIFIAIHADAYKDAYSTGASVFALSLRGASSEAARWLAEKENYSELGGVNLNTTNDTVRSVLIDLSQTASISASLILGADVLRQVATISPLHKAKVEQAPFMVLKSPDIPSILLETGFISNPQEERALSNPAYQRKMALAIQRGIDQYFRQHPPNGPMIATGG